MSTTWRRMMARKKKEDISFVGNLPVYYDSESATYYILFPDGEFFCVEGLHEIVDSRYSKLNELHRVQTLVGNFELISDLPDFMRKIAKKIMAMQSELRKAD